MDPSHLLNQFLGSFGQSNPNAPAGDGTQQNETQASSGGLNLGTLASGAALGGVAGLLLNSKAARKIGKKTMKVGQGVAGIGGLALVGGLAYTAYRSYKNNQSAAGSQSGAQAPRPVLPAPTGSGFEPEAAPIGESSMALLVMRSMIAAAKADGHIDADEQAKIFDRLDDLDLDAQDKAFLLSEMRNPASIDQLANEAKTPEMALEVYAASVLAIDPDTADEKAYLAMLARVLNIEPELAQEVEQAIAQMNAG
ncbi:MAG: tellurite resistance TerB family protein [Hyphomicrobiales bacterium]